MEHIAWINENDEELEERYRLSGIRLSEIAAGESLVKEEPFRQYFWKTACFLKDCEQIYDKIANGEFPKMTLEECAAENRSFYEELLPGNYEESYTNPAYACEVLGEEFGKALCFLSSELRSLRVFAFEQDKNKTTILRELFLEIYGMFAAGEVAYKQLREAIYWFLYDYADLWMGSRVRELLDPSLTFATDIVMESDFPDLRYLYRYGEYISENETKTAAYLNTLPEEVIERIARTFTEGYRTGFVLKGVDLSGKDTVNIRYPIGFERVIREAVLQFRGMGLKPVICRSASDTLNRLQNMKVGYVSTSPNKQFDYDHRFDEGLYVDKRLNDRRIDCLRKAYEVYREPAAGYSGPAIFESFGEEPFRPVRKDSACRLSERQQNLGVEYASMTSQLVNEFINQEERSFTIIDYPCPAIGDQFEEIFREIEKVNNLDRGKYEKIQQRMIETLDRAKEVHILGRGRNMTNITVTLGKLEDITKQTNFENCLADVNIPVGEVFTSPELRGTGGLLHVSQVYLEGLCYKDLKIWVEDGMITDYSCGNFPSEEEGKTLIRENILYNHDTLPMGEFAIGTNTSAFVVAEKYHIEDKFPILIAEKTGPHIAFGDTCYAHNEDVRVFNPDGREIVARENDCSRLRHESLMKAYFNCHTDITIPYGEIGLISAVMPDHNQVPIIMDGRFVLEGTLELNEAFADEKPGERSNPSTMEDEIEKINEETAGGVYI